MQLPESVKTVLSRLRAAGFEAAVVGGSVRDSLLLQTPQDYDVATAATPDEVKRVFADFRVLETGLKHGTVTVLAPLPIEITTFREDGDYRDHRRPESVRYTTSLAADLARRDFTINAMAFGENGLVDLFGGKDDLQNGIIRAVGDPAVRFEEDALRILRALRFAAVLDFEIEPKTADAMRQKRGLLAAVSAERIAAELTRLLCGKAAERVLCTYPDVWGKVLPELLPMRGFDQKNPHHIYDVLTHTAKAVAAVPPNAVLRLAALFHDSGKPRTFSVDEKGIGHFYGHAAESEKIAAAVLARLKFDNRTKTQVKRLVAEHDRQIEPTDRAVGRALRQLGGELFFDLLALKRADAMAQAPDSMARLAIYDTLEETARRLLEKAACFSLADLAVKGGDLMAAGAPAGPSLGAALAALLTAVTEEGVPNEKAALIAYYKEHLK